MTQSQTRDPLFLAIGLARETYAATQMSRRARASLRFRSHYTLSSHFLWHADMASVCTGVPAVGLCKQQSSSAHQLSRGLEARKDLGREGEVSWGNFARVQKYCTQGYMRNTGEERAREVQAGRSAFEARIERGRQGKSAWSNVAEVPKYSRERCIRKLIQCRRGRLHACGGASLGFT